MLVDCLLLLLLLCWALYMRPGARDHRQLGGGSVMLLLNGSALLDEPGADSFIDVLLSL
jgi:hypothetical protein